MSKRLLTLFFYPLQIKLKTPLRTWFSNRKLIFGKNNKYQLYRKLLSPNPWRFFPIPSIVPCFDSIASNNIGLYRSLTNANSNPSASGKRRHENTSYKRDCRLLEPVRGPRIRRNLRRNQTASRLSYCRAGPKKADENGAMSRRNV